MLAGGFHRLLGNGHGPVNLSFGGFNQHGIVNRGADSYPLLRCQDARQTEHFGAVGL
jgi:hypothetical protein